MTVSGRVGEAVALGVSLVGDVGGYADYERKNSRHHPRSSAISVGRFIENRVAPSTDKIRRTLIRKPPIRLCELRSATKCFYAI